MNHYLERYAIKNMALGLNSTWVLAVDQPPKAPIASYYTLASATIHREQIPSVTSKLPGYPVPVVLLARLAVAKQFQRSGLGAKSLASALRHAVQLSDQGLPAFGLVLDVLDNDALSFYQKFEIFQPLSDNPMRLFVVMDTLRQI